MTAPCPNLGAVRVFAARVLGVIDPEGHPEALNRWNAAEQERVQFLVRTIERAEDGLAECARDAGTWPMVEFVHPVRYEAIRDEAWADLVRVGTLYGVAP